MATVTLTWHSMHDERTCKVCLALDGHTWVYPLGEKQFTNEIVHPEFGVVWNVQTGSMAHGHRGNCRCNITFELDFKDLLERVMKIHALVLEALPIPTEAE